MISTLTSSDAFFKNGVETGKALRKIKAHFLKTTLSVLPRKDRRSFIMLALADIVISIVDILSLALLLWIIQLYIQPPKETSSSFLTHWFSARNSISFIAVFFFLFGIKNLAAFLLIKAQHRLIAKVGVQISQTNLSGYQTSPYEEFINVDSSVHLRNIGYQPFDFCLYMLSGVQQIITQSALILVTIVAILIFNAKLFCLILLILLPPVIGVFYFIKRQLATARLGIKESNQKSFQYLLDALKGYVEGNIYGRNNFFLKRFVDQRKKFSHHLFESISLQMLPGRLIETFAVMGLFLLIVIAQLSKSVDGNALITIGAFMAAAYKIIPGIVKIINTVGQIKAHEIAIGEISIPQSNIFKTQEKETINSIEFLDISFRYNGTPVLAGLSFSVQPGDFIGIQGKSGQGKTTILNLMLGFLSPDCGTVSVNGVSFTKDQLKAYWASISYVRQQAFFIYDSILRNITLEEACFDEEKLKYALNVSGLADLVGTFDDGVNKVITENGKNISGGQQQRVALARALYKDADLILLDEPFNELDESSEISLLEHFKQLAGAGKMVVMVTHNKKALGFCNKIVSLDE